MPLRLERTVVLKLCREVERECVTCQNLLTWNWSQSHPQSVMEVKRWEIDPKGVWYRACSSIEQWYPSLGGRLIPVTQPCQESGTTPTSLTAFDGFSTPILHRSSCKSAASLRKGSCRELSSRRRERLRRTYSWTAGRNPSLS